MTGRTIFRRVSDTFADGDVSWIDFGRRRDLEDFLLCISRRGRGKSEDGDDRRRVGGGSDDNYLSRGDDLEGRDRNETSRDES